MGRYLSNNVVLYLSYDSIDDSDEFASMDKINEILEALNHHKVDENKSESAYISTSINEKVEIVISNLVEYELESISVGNIDTIAFYIQFFKRETLVAEIIEAIRILEDLNFRIQAVVPSKTSKIAFVPTYG